MEANFSLIKKIYQKRPEWSHKGDFGKLLVVGGSNLYSGSPMLNALAAYRAGCDLVRVVSPENAANAIKAYSPDLIAFPLKGNNLSPMHVKQITEMQNDADAIVIGGGLGRTKEVFAAVRKIILNTKLPTVIDADAIHAINFKLNENFIVTPHSYEFSVLSGVKPMIDIEKRAIEAKLLAIKLNCTILLKGHIDVISNGVSIALSKTGNSYMTKGGMGDTLAGICGALLARGVKPFDAACAAAYINGRAGDLAAKKLHEGLMASDLVKHIPEAIKGNETSFSLFK
jgi:NAD(P)H-hydrate epimerase